MVLDNLRNFFPNYRSKYPKGFQSILEAFSEEYRKMSSAIEYMEYRIDLSERDFMFQRVEVPKYNEYRYWNRLIKKIIKV